MISSFNNVPSYISKRLVVVSDRIAEYKRNSINVASSSGKNGPLERWPHRGGTRKTALEAKSDSRSKSGRAGTECCFRTGSSSKGTTQYVGRRYRVALTTVQRPAIGCITIYTLAPSFQQDTI